MKPTNQAKSTELTGGAGFTYEDTCAAIYLGALLGKDPCRGLPNRSVVRVSSQQGAAGEPLDDIIVDAEGADELRARLSLQVKKALTISSAESNTDFREIVKRAHETCAKADFKVDVDRVGAVTGNISDDSKRAFEDICEWARLHDSVDAFHGKFVPGASNESHRKIREDIGTILKDSVEADRLDLEVFRLLRHFVLLKFDLLHDGSPDATDSTARLSHCLRPEDAARSGNLWSSLRVIAREAGGRGAVFDRPTLVAKIRGSFRLAGMHPFRRSLERLEEEARAGIKDIAIDIAGVRIARGKVTEEAKAKLKQHRFVQIIGLPGTGKSAVLRLLAEGYLESGPTLFLKTDRLSGPTWSAYASSIGLDSIPLEHLLLEIGCCGTPVLAIDGMDRIVVGHRGIILDLLNTILGNPDLKAAWSIAVTVRDGGTEDIRTWLPPALFDESPPAIVEVGPFNHEESTLLATANPAMRPLLFGDERIREISRRPFFAAVIASGLGRPQEGSLVRANSEIQLIEAWWARGGYNANPGRLLNRKETLRRIASLGATALGRSIPIDGLDLEAVAELQSDGILKESAPGRFRFTHDIFFEWAYLHVLMGCESEWPAEIRKVGEPPALGRVVELMSQKTFATDPQAWGSFLSTLEASYLRPQWARAWLLGPIGHPEFLDKAGPFTDILFQGTASRVRRLAVWFQAEKTRPNPAILDGSILKSASLAEAVRLADLFAWPSEIGSWRRICQWFINTIAQCQVEAIPDIVSVFEVWQNVFSDTPNETSQQMMGIIRSWLIDIEDVRHPEGDRMGPSRWGRLPEGGVKALEERLRNLVLRSARSMPNEAKSYLVRVTGRSRLREEAFKEILSFSPILAEKLPSELMSLLMVELKRRLPNDPGRRGRGTFEHGISHHDRRELGLNPNTRLFFPASPVWEPFPALFRSSPQDGLAAVKELTNHAITAWRQLGLLDSERPKTPIPLVMEFPWGRQTFWGNNQVYTWFRGNGGPYVVASGLMALEKWAFTELDTGRDADDLIREIVAGHESCAILGIAVGIAMKAKKVSATTLPLVCSQHLWWWDIARRVYDSSASGLTESLHKSQDHILALREQNAWEMRRFDIRSLVMLFVLSGEEKLRAAAQSTIQAFPQKLPFETEETRQAGESTDSLRRQAEIWAELGKPENYVAKRVDGNMLQIEHQNPMANDPDIVASEQGYQTLNQQLGLLRWAEDSLSGNNVAERMTLSKAIETAQTLDSPQMFTEPTQVAELLNFSVKAIAATAAVALKFSTRIPETDRQWAEEIIFRAAESPEVLDDDFYAESSDPYHICISALQGLVFLARENRTPKAKPAMIKLAAHPRRAISQAAIGAILGFWKTDSHFSWIGFDLAIRMSTEHWNGNREESIRFKKESIAKAIESALAHLMLEAPDFALAVIPPAWVFAPEKPRRGPFGEEGEAPGLTWREPDIHLDHQYLSKLLRRIPFQEILKETEKATRFWISVNPLSIGP